MRISINIFTSFEVEKSEEAVKKAKRNREWRYEYMTLLMRDQENQEIGEKRGEKRGEKNGKEKMVRNAADGADPILRQVLKLGAGGDPVIGVSRFRIIAIAAYIAYISFHEKYLLIK